MTLSVVVCTAHRTLSLAATIRSIGKQSYRDHQLIVVVQGENEHLLGTLADLARQDSRIDVVRLQEFGKSRAINAAMKVAKGEIVCFTDDDCEPREDWLQTIVDCFEADPNLGVVGGRLVAPRRPPAAVAHCQTSLPGESYYDPKSGVPWRPDCFWCGANVAMRMAVIRETGPFDDYLGPGTEFPASEDSDYGLRIEEMGFATRTTPRSVVVHTHGWRVGPRAVRNHFRNYAVSQGALSAKLVMRGHSEARAFREHIFGQRRAPLPPTQLVHHAKQLWLRQWRQAGYDACVKGYVVDDSGLLRRR
jgi:GT2 family glycosyltransferase